MPTYQTPGVYYERVDASGPAIGPVRMDVAGFVGIAPRGPVDTPVPIQSWRQFQAYFGDFGAGFLAYAVRAFFENGGRRCWVVRVASRDPAGGAATASLDLYSPSNQPVWRIAACSPGTWSNALTITLAETHRAQTTSLPERSTPEALAVASTGGLARAMLVKLSQPGKPPVYNVISKVDAAEGRLLWVNPKTESRLPYDAPLDLAAAGLDPRQPVAVASVEYTLIVKEARRVLAVYEGLTLVPEQAAYGPVRLGKLAIPTRLDEQRTIPSAPPPVVIQELRNTPIDPREPIQAAPGDHPLSGGTDGLALLQADDWIGQEISPLDSDVTQALKRRGIRALNDVNEVSMVTVPDIHIQPIAEPETRPLPECIPDPCLPPPTDLPARPLIPFQEMPPKFSDDDIFQVQAALVQLCEARRDRIALLDPPVSASRDDALGMAAARAWRHRFDSRFAAFYYPWLRVVDPRRPATEPTRAIPPCGHVAGQYAQADFKVGVHKAPANAPLDWAQDTTAHAGQAAHGLLNDEGINVIRPLPGRGLRILGARTLSSDPDWRYVNVRRLLIMIEKAIYLSTQWAVFEPNDALTRAKLHLSLTGFLFALWQRGALMGSEPQAAFFVQCDDANNPPRERDNGRLLAQVGVAASQPFEFVVLRVGRTQNEFEIKEAGMALGGK